MVVTQTEHDDCAGCFEQAERAAVMARVTGSVGATHSDRGHSARVERKWCVQFDSAS